jgi:hypothetical protein
MVEIAFEPLNTHQAAGWASLTDNEKRSSCLTRYECAPVMHACTYSCNACDLEDATCAFGDVTGTFGFAG